LAWNQGEKHERVFRRDALKVIGANRDFDCHREPARFAIRAGRDLSYKPEAGAQLRVLRWKRFVQGDEDQWAANTRKFTATDRRACTRGCREFRRHPPKGGVAANIGSGPDIVLGWYDDPHQYADKLLDLSELATYLDAKYGGWYEVCKRYCMHEGRWIRDRLRISRRLSGLSQSMLKAAGYEKPPSTTTVS